MKIERINRGKKLLARKIHINDLCYVLNFGFDGSYDLYLKGDFVANFESYKKAILFLKGLENDS